MVDFREPVYRIEYQKLMISIYIWGDEHVFFAQIRDERGCPVAALSCHVRRSGKLTRHAVLG